MKVAIIGTVGIPANYGGFETLAEQLVRNCHSPQIDYTIYCSSKSYQEKLKEYLGARLKYTPLKANGLQSIPYDIVSLIRAARENDVIVVLGVSGASFLPAFRLFSKKKLIINIDGLEHRREKWKPWVRRFLKYSEKLAVRHADTIISDNKAIQDYVKSEYGVDSELIAYGGDHVLTSSNLSDSDKVMREYGIDKGNYALGLCRVEPENNVEMILEAFSRIPQRQLVFFGNWDHSDYAKNLRSKYSAFPNIQLIQALYDNDKINILRANCRVYLHGHSAGGTNPSLVEAMFFGIPIIAYDCPYNRETCENKALFFKNSDDLVNTIEETDFLATSAKALTEIANTRYTWDKIAAAYEDIILI